MTKAQKKQLESFLKLLDKAHKGIRKALETRNAEIALDVLTQCQEGVIEQGGMIEESEGEGTKTVSLMEDYCEVIFQVHEEISNDPYTNPSKIYNKLNSSLIQIENSVRKDIPVRRDIVFLPYKASMWDSLESVWMAADADPDCDAYVVPIPYYDKNPDGSLGTFHYEGDDFPEYVPIMHYDTYRVEVRRPDVIYIHNPYDYANYVTTIDSRFYSDALKQYTDLLVYIPYYVTSGGMNEARGFCPAYYNVDYIIMQSEQYRPLFDKNLPKGKLQALGSPKIDRIIRMCNDPGELPVEWKSILNGKKAYFYNTTINGMLGNTLKFLQKMEYVFKCFQGRNDACLVWRPHPLLETTFTSMRPEFYPIYLKLKNYFIEYGLGIYDDTPDIERTIAFCDAYIGNAGSSVTTLFGMAGKPMFILNNAFDRVPGPEDWRGGIINGFFPVDTDEWKVTQGNKLYRASNQDYHYQYVCDLSTYAYGGYYIRAIEAGDRVYVCPGNAQDIVVVTEGKVEKRIPLECCLERAGAFCGAWKIGDYIFLLPLKYPAIVRYDIQNDKVDYIRGYNDVFIGKEQGKVLIGGSWAKEDILFLASPTEDKILSIDSKSMQTKIYKTGVRDGVGWINLIPDGSDFWLLPYEGGVITRWNPDTGEVQEYSGLPEGYQCINLNQGYPCMERPFGTAAFSDKYVYLPPYWGNMYLRLDKKSGKLEEWTPPFPVVQEEENGYFRTNVKANFLHRSNAQGKNIYRLFSGLNRRLYEVNLEDESYTEIPIEFDIEELRAYNPGFCVCSGWLRYACYEDYFNSLDAFLDGTTVGTPFDREKQLREYGDIIANGDGTCGEKIHKFIKGKL